MKNSKNIYLLFASDQVCDSIMAIKQYPDITLRLRSVFISDLRKVT
jgi:hypothetical protein